MTQLRPVAPDEFLLADFVRPLARRWRTLVLGALAGVGLALAMTVVWPRSYKAQVSFTPEQTPGSSLGNSVAGALGGIGDGLGSLVGMPGGLPAGLSGSGPNSPELFAAVLKSRELLEATLLSRFGDPDDPSRQRTLVEIMKPRGGTPARRLGNARRRLEKRATVSSDRRSGVVTLDLTMRDPRLAADVANRMAELLNVYNLERRQSSSRAQRRFVETRLAEAEAELRDAERAQTAFLIENRRFQGSPALEAQVARYARDLRLKQDLVLGLRKSYEDARLAEVRDTPVLSIVDHAAPPDRPSSPRPLLWAILGGLLGVTAAVGTILWRVALGRQTAVRVADGTNGRGVTADPPEVQREPVVRGEVWAAAHRPSERA